MDFLFWFSGIHFFFLISVCAWANVWVDGFWREPQRGACSLCGGRADEDARMTRQRPSMRSRRLVGCRDSSRNKHCWGVSEAEQLSEGRCA